MKRMWLMLVMGLFLCGTAVTPAEAAAEKDKGGKSIAKGDMKFVKKAASGGMMEVQLGQLAQTKAQAQEVKTFASQMVTDHGKANDELKRIAQQKNITLPEKMEKKHQAKVDKLTKLSGTEFDKAYMREMVKDHEEDVADFKKAAQKVKDAELNTWFGTTLPILEHHLQMAKDTAQKMGVPVKKGEEKARK